MKTYAGLIDLSYTLDQHKKVIDQKLEEGHRGIKIKIGLDDLEADIKRTRPMAVEGGFVTPPDYPGCGVMFDWDMLAEYRLKIPSP